MSTFDGNIDGFEGIAVDRFDALNCDVKLLFLSHCHTDHMVGLADINWHQQQTAPLYLSEVSSLIIKKRLPSIKDLVILKIGDATDINIGENDRFTVTALPAGHCPGSVMFLFERPGKCALYTGDFRLSSSTIDEMIALKRLANAESRLDCIYVDSSFFSPEYDFFPSQRQSANTISTIASQWVNSDPNNIVALRPPANIGYEFLVMELSRYLGQRLHVSNALYAEYSAIPELSECITQAIESSARIHLCTPETQFNWKSDKCRCLPSLKAENVCIIRPTACRWTNLKSTDACYEKNGFKNWYFVCYSNHASYAEIKYLIEYLKPYDIKLNVVPKEADSRKRMIDELGRIMELYRPKETPTVDNGDNLVYYRFDNIKWTEVKRRMVESDDELADIVIKRRKGPNQEQTQ